MRGRLQALPDHRIGQDVLVVVEADEGRRPRAVGAVGEEREAERPEQREDVHHEQQRDRRRDQQAALVAAPGVVDGRCRGERAGGERHPERRGRRQQRDRQRAMMTTARTKASGQLSSRSSRKRAVLCRPRRGFGRHRSSVSTPGKRRTVRLAGARSASSSRGHSSMWPASVRSSSWKAAMLSSVVLASCWPVMARSILLLALHQQLEELRNVPGVLLPFEARRPGAVPRAVGHVFRIVVDRLDGALAAGGRERVLHVGRQPPLHEVDRLLDLQVGRPGHDHEGLAADIGPADELAVRPLEARAPGRRRPCRRPSRSPG